MSSFIKIKYEDIRFILGNTKNANTVTVHPFDISFSQLATLDCSLGDIRLIDWSLSDIVPSREWWIGGIFQMGQAFNEMYKTGRFDDNAIPYVLYTARYAGDLGYSAFLRVYVGAFVGDSALRDFGWALFANDVDRSAEHVLPVEHRRLMSRHILSNPPDHREYLKARSGDGHVFYDTINGKTYGFDDSQEWYTL